ncbi:NUT family member 2G-like isoform X2 [Narcine bancroftii]|uniref:NUT family member 2G-like isoform X2 n=1 Tax=Narcine bancroftii TaxID=1343680 RepID=UPI00383222B3
MEASRAGPVPPPVGERPQGTPQLTLLSLEQARPPKVALPRPSDPGARTLLLTSPCLTWVRAAHSCKVLSLGLVPCLNFCRLASSKGVLVSRTPGLLLHKEGHPARGSDPGQAMPPWRGPSFPSPAPSGPLVLSGPPAGGGLKGPLPSGYSRGVYNNFCRWQQYKGLARPHYPWTPDNEALACFFMFMEFEQEEIAQRSPVDSMSGHTDLSAEILLESGTTRKPVNEMLADLGGRMARGTGRSQQCLQQSKPPVCGGKAQDQTIPPEAVDQYIKVMESLGQDHPQNLPEPSEEYDSELLHYIDELCSNNSFIVKTETIIHPHFLMDLLSPSGILDMSQLLQELQTQDHLSQAELDGAGSAQAPIAQISGPSNLQSSLTPEKIEPLSSLVAQPVEQECPYSSRLQLLALQSAHDDSPASAGEAEASLGLACSPLPSRQPLLTELPPRSFQGKPQLHPLSPQTPKPHIYGPVVRGDQQPGTLGPVNGKRLVSCQKEREANFSANDRALSTVQSQSRDSTGDQTQSRAPIVDQNQSRVPTENQNQSRAPNGNENQSKAPTEDQNQSRAPTGDQNQSRAQNGHQTQSRAQTGNQNQSSAPTGDQAQSKASTDAQTQRFASTENQTQSKVPACDHAQMKAGNQAPNKHLAPAYMPRAEAPSRVYPLVQGFDMQVPEQGSVQGKGSQRPEDKPCCNAPQHQAGRQGLRKPKLPQQVGIGPNLPSTRMGARGEKRRAQGRAVRRSKRTR